MPDESEWGGWSHKTDRWLTAETHGGIKHADEHSPNLVHNARNVPTQLRLAYFLQALHSLPAFTEAHKSLLQTFQIYIDLACLLIRGK